MRLICVLSAASLLFIGFIFYCISPKTQVVLFDERTVQAQLVRQLAEHKATEAQVKDTTLKFKKSLHEVLTQYAKRHEVVILERNAVLAGGKDITSQLTRELSQVMRSKS